MIREESETRRLRKSWCANAVSEQMRGVCKQCLKVDWKKSFRYVVKEGEWMDEDSDVYEEDFTDICPMCGGCGLSIEGWDCEWCDGWGFWDN
jgi:hypothetical protein